jgi:Reverse transcriptase (RNA-dependent DNA polymerase)
MLVLSLAVSSNWDIKQLDVSNVFLHGDLQVRVYMHQPQGFSDPNHPYFVCLLHKSLYEIKQAPCTWFQKLSDVLVQLNFKPSIYFCLITMAIQPWFLYTLTT